MDYPKRIQIGFQEGTCPLHCKKCPAFGEPALTKKEIVKMPIDKAEYLINEIAKFPYKPIIFPHIFTEPFANNDLKYILELCRIQNLPIRIITNGILFNDEWADLLIKIMDRNCSVSFSLDAFSQQTYDEVRSKEYDLATIEEKIESFIKKRNAQGKTVGPRITVNFTIENDNYMEKELFLDRWKYIVDAVRLTVGYDSERKIPEKFRTNQHPKGCSYLFNTMIIDADGSVRACCVDAFGSTNFGNVFEEDILSIWNGKHLERQRKLLLEGNLPHDNFCYGCEANVLGNMQTVETEEFIINQSEYTVYYNLKKYMGLEDS